MQKPFDDIFNRNVLRIIIESSIIYLLFNIIINEVHTLMKKNTKKGAVVNQQDDSDDDFVDFKKKN